MITELKPTNGRKSFYGKALVKETKDSKILISYSTTIAKYSKKKDEVRIYGWFSNTSTSHLNSFLTRLGFRNLTAKEIRQIKILKR